MKRIAWVHPKLSQQLSGMWSVGHRPLPLAGVPPASDNLGCTQLP